ncbi:MAG TPA: lipopolysaccharide kinase InaA family protein [Thermoanaerobaculia bacterium]|nr:lipopolysaccharide kinase InaA family protein [Thermoanaerobaculia bacterium]
MAAPERTGPAPPGDRVARFEAAGLEGEVDRRYEGVDLAAELPRLLDPAAALETLHWGRNYLYLARWPIGGYSGPAGRTIEVVVKQFRHQSVKARWRRRQKGSKALRAWRAARELAALGISTPEPVLYAESRDLAGPAYFVCRYLPNRIEVRYPLRVLNAGGGSRDLGGLEGTSLVRALGRLARRLHERGVWFRDYTSGNVLLEPGAPGEPAAMGDDGALAAAEALADRMALVDLNRARFGSAPTLSERMRDLSRMPLHREDLRRLFLDAYWHPESGGLRRRLGDLLYATSYWSFRLRHRSKQGARSRIRRLQDLLLPRSGAHAHIPAAERGASARDKTVWDELSDQPHQHASRLEKLRVRVADLPAHSRSLVVAAGALRRARRRQREILARLYREPVIFGGLGIGIRPSGAAGSPAWHRLLSAIDELGVRCVLLRAHPWERDHDDEVALAAALAARGLELTVALPQNRALVRDPQRWRAAVAELAERLAPYARHYQVGQAINRSKWGVWRPSEYVELFRVAAEEIRARRRDAELLGPAVIDFEPHATAALLGLEAEGLRFDALASLLYVDRRGAPENEQMGFDSVSKAALLKALAETARNCPSGRSWITEVNWPLREGPHSPAGRDVSVGEEEQASYLVRYMVGIGAAGLAERQFWWQLAAKGYGLIDPLADASERGGAWRRRPAYAALATLQRLLDGALSLGPVEITTATERLYRFRDRADREILVGWSLAGRRLLELPSEVERIVERDGEELRGSGRRVEIEEAPRFFVLADG